MSALSTLAYFDQFDYPLTRLECWRFAIGGRAAPRESIDTELEELRREGKICERDGFFARAGRDSLFALRQARSRLAEQKYAKALRFASLLRSLPFVRMIGICNTLALSNSREDADIDFFIVAASRRAWTVRLFATILAQLLGERPGQHHMRDSFCLSFFVTEDCLNLRAVALDDDDVYLAEWVQQLVPVFDRGNVYERFWNENRWIASLLPNAVRKIPAERRTLTDSRFIRFVRSLFELKLWVIGPVFERFVRRLQWKKFPAKIRALANHETRVVVTRDMLKFHENDRREEYRRFWRQHLSV